MIDWKKSAIYGRHTPTIQYLHMKVLQQLLQSHQLLTITLYILQFLYKLQQKPYHLMQDWLLCHLKSIQQLLKIPLLYFLYQLQAFLIQFILQLKVTLFSDHSPTGNLDKGLTSANAQNFLLLQVLAGGVGDCREFEFNSTIEDFEAVYSEGTI